MRRRMVFLLVALWLATQCVMASHTAKREMRAVWIATVKNIDWPSQPALEVEQQRKEMLSLLNRLEQLHINTIILQIRPTADAFYASPYEPWSQYLTGRQGVAPAPWYDPLAFVIEEAHKRCIEVHAWINPYRVAMESNTQLLDSSNLYFARPDLFVEYGGKLYFDPGYDDTREYLNAIVADVVRRYDVDAIHFDDYFYPYRVAGKDFPDAASFAAEPRGYGAGQKDAWRRNNVNLVISELQQTIKSLKPWVEFGISPFGVWRNADKDVDGSNTRAGMTNYDDLYADILKWLREGSIDYVVPQLYWEIGKKNADYSVLVDWWSKHCYGRNLYIGLFASGLGVNKPQAWHTGNELIRQMHLNRTYPNVLGEAFYSARPMLNNPLGLLDSLSTAFYQYPALTPLNPAVAAGKECAPPTNVRVVQRNGGVYLSWEAGDEQDVAYYVVYAFCARAAGSVDDARNIYCKVKATELELSSVVGLKGEYTFAVTAVNRYRQESEAVAVRNKTFSF